jgi:hypothetical protein
MVTAAISAKQQFLSEETNGNNNSSRKEEKLLTLANLVGVYHGKVEELMPVEYPILQISPEDIQRLKHKVLKNCQGLKWIGSRAPRKDPKKRQKIGSKNRPRVSSLQVGGSAAEVHGKPCHAVEQWLASCSAWDGMHHITAIARLLPRTPCLGPQDGQPIETQELLSEESLWL